jgi:hypothetical protein
MKIVIYQQFTALLKGSYFGKAYVRPPSAQRQDHQTRS